MRNFESSFEIWWSRIWVNRDLERTDLKVFRVGDGDLGKVLFLGGGRNLEVEGLVVKGKEEVYGRN